MKFYKYILFIIFLLTHIAKAQQLQFEHIGDKLGLPSHECYNVMQDSKGYIWISTEAGLCRYNGTNSLVFDKKNGLPENACYTVAEDSKGKLWILTSKNRILNFSNNTLIESKFSQNYAAKLGGELSQSYALDFKNDSIVINTHTYTYIIDSNSASVSLILPDTNSGYYFIKNNNSLISVKSETNRNLIVKLAKKGLITMAIRTEKETKRYIIPYKNQENLSWRVLTTTNKKGESFIANGTLLVKLNNDLSYFTYELPSDALCIYSDNADGLWIGTIKNGVYYYSNTTIMENKIQNLNGFSVTGVCVDSEKGVWCTTLEKSVFYCRNKNSINYANNKGLEKQSDLLKYEGGKIFTSTENNELIELKNEGITRYPLNFVGTSDIADVLKEDKGWVVAGKKIVLKTNEDFTNNKYVTNKDRKLYIGANQLTHTSNRRVFAVHYGIVFEINGETVIDRKNPLESAGKCVLYIGNSTLLYGCKDGLYKMFLEKTGSEKQYKTQKVKGIEGNIVKMIESSQHEIWVATKENGLYILKGDSVLNMTSILKIPTERCFDMVEDPFGSIWLGTYIGLIKIKNKNLSIYNTLNGLTSNEIFKVATDSNYVYVSTVEGINRLPLFEELTNTLAPNLYLNNIRVNDSLVDVKKSIRLAYNQNSFKIEFDALTFKELNTPTLYYQLKEKNKGTFEDVIVKGNVISLNNLLPNTYELNVYAVNNDGVRTAKPVTVHFEILKPFWQSVWFITFCILTFMFLVVFTTRKIINRIRKKEEEKTEINKQLAEFQLTALQAQMNPHFIFNAINSVQRYILEKSKQEAYDYLAKFGKLIRMVLNNSEEKTLPLQQELEMLDLYVQLEQMRFNNKFDFNVVLSENVNPYEIQIPAMLIQPYIENAIWHGLMNLNNERKGVLKLDISLIDELLKIVIEDNGVGRKRSGEFKKESVHNPLAMKLTAQRLAIINQIKNYEGAKIELFDLEQGTRVEIHLPI